MNVIFIILSFFLIPWVTRQNFYPTSDPTIHSTIITTITTSTTTTTTTWPTMIFCRFSRNSQVFRQIVMTITMMVRKNGSEGGDELNCAWKIWPASAMIDFLMHDETNHNPLKFLFDAHSLNFVRWLIGLFLFIPTFKIVRLCFVSCCCNGNVKQASTQINCYFLTFSSSQFLIIIYLFNPSIVLDYTGVE